jgi:hypothetical protein
MLIQQDGARPYFDRQAANNQGKLDKRGRQA